ncbi:MAG: tetraacyldisaccharide 4'-kinase [Longimicrobiales bacterium]
MSGLASIRSALPRLWAGEGGPLAQFLLSCAAPLEWGFRAAVATRGTWYDQREGNRGPIPVVSVGNLTVGGAGKTPFLKALWSWLEANGARAAVVTRGYGDDEVALYRQWFGADRVFVAPARIEGVREASARGMDLALVDDGFQHRRLARDLDLLLIAAEDPFPLRLLPRGPYREPLSAAARASMVIVTDRTGSGAQEAWRERLLDAAPGVSVSDITLGAPGWMSQPEGPMVSGRDVLAVASTASPWTFGATVEKLLPDSTVQLMSFPDHHDYSTQDVGQILARAQDRLIATTEKDAVKLAPYPEMEGRYSVVEFGVIGSLPEGLTRALVKLLPAER